MTTAAYITWLSKRIGGNSFSRVELREAINLAQNEILGREIRFMRIKPDPFLVTTDGTYRYVASTSVLDSLDGATTYDVRHISRLYTNNNRRSGILDYGGVHSISSKPDKLANPHTSPEVIMSVDFEQSLAPSSSDAVIKFFRENNPGTTTETYMVEAYKWPTQIVSENIALSIPETFQRNLLKYAVLQELEYTEYGSADRPIELYEREISKFLSWANGGATTDPTCTPPRDC